MSGSERYEGITQLLAERGVFSEAEARRVVASIVDGTASPGQWEVVRGEVMAALQEETAQSARRAVEVLREVAASGPTEWVWEPLPERG